MKLTSTDGPFWGGLFFYYWRVW